MPLETQVKATRPGGSLTFDFVGNIAKVAVGIRAFNLSFGAGDEHHVETVGIQLISSYTNNALVVLVNATLDDDGGNNLMPDGSSVEVVAIAWTGIDNPDVTLANALDVANGQASSGIAVPCTTPLVRAALLSGFELSFGNTDHEVKVIEAGAGTAQSGSTVQVTASARMFDDSGNSATTATIDGGLLVSCDPTLPFQVLATGDLQNARKTLAFDSRINTFEALLTGFRVQYAGNTDHDVTTVGGVISIQSSEAGSATASGATYINDDSGNRQDDTLSHVTGVVVGYVR